MGSPTLSVLAAPCVWLELTSAALPALHTQILMLRQKITSVTDSVKGMLMGGKGGGDSSARLDAFKSECVLEGLQWGRFGISVELQASGAA